MALDLDQLRRNYAELINEALLEIDPSELVEAARECYDSELAQRGLRPGKRARVPRTRTKSLSSPWTRASRNGWTTA